MTVMTRDQDQAAALQLAEAVREEAQRRGVSPAILAVALADLAARLATQAGGPLAAARMIEAVARAARRGRYGGEPAQVDAGVLRDMPEAGSG